MTNDKKIFAKSLALALLVFFPSIALTATAQEITLLESDGTATAYIDVDDDATIYLWGGKPVAYLDNYDDGTWHVYGFNGNHLGWLENGVIWMKSGYAACATPDAFSGIQKIEPIKGIQSIKPIQSIQRIAPIKPIFRNSFGSSGCSFHFLAGAK